MNIKILYSILFWGVIASFLFLNGCKEKSPRFVERTLAGISLDDSEEKLFKVLGKTTPLESNWVSPTKSFFYYDVNQKIYLKFLEVGVQTKEKHFARIVMMKEKKKSYTQYSWATSGPVHDESEPITKKIKIKYKKINLSKGILKTGKGIRIGDNIKKILKIYGKPHKELKKDGQTIYEYGTDDQRYVKGVYMLTLVFENNKLVKWEVYKGC